jgi:hypothetical protein
LGKKRRTKKKKKKEKKKKKKRKKITNQPQNWGENGLTASWMRALCLEERNSQPSLKRKKNKKRKKQKKQKTAAAWFLRHLVSVPYQIRKLHTTCEPRFEPQKGKRTQRGKKKKKKRKKEKKRKQKKNMTRPQCTLPFCCCIFAEGELKHY